MDEHQLQNIRDMLQELESKYNSHLEHLPQMISESIQESNPKKIHLIIKGLSTVENHDTYMS